MPIKLQEQTSQKQHNSNLYNHKDAQNHANNLNIYNHSIIYRQYVQNQYQIKSTQDIDKFQKEILINGADYLFNIVPTEDGFVIYDQKEKYKNNQNLCLLAIPEDVFNKERIKIIEKYKSHLEEGDRIKIGRIYIDIHEIHWSNKPLYRHQCYSQIETYIEDQKLAIEQKKSVPLISVSHYQKSLSNQDNMSLIDSNPICKYCNSRTITVQNPLVSICDCNGSNKYVHRECIINWLQIRLKNNFIIDQNTGIYCVVYDYFICEICKSMYKIKNDPQLFRRLFNWKIQENYSNNQDAFHSASQFQHIDDIINQQFQALQIDASLRPKVYLQSISKHNLLQSPPHRSINENSQQKLTQSRIARRSKYNLNFITMILTNNTTKLIYIIQIKQSIQYNIGRSITNHIRIQQQSISRIHCKIKINLQDNKIYLIDCMSKFGSGIVIKNKFIVKKQDIKYNLFVKGRTKFIPEWLNGQNKGIFKLFRKIGFLCAEK